MDDKPNVRYTTSDTVTLLYVPDPWKALETFEKVFGWKMSVEAVKVYEAAMKKMKKATDANS